MEYSPDIKIGGGEKKKQYHEDITELDYVIEGAGIGDDVLEKAKSIKEGQKESVVYDTYDNSDKSFSTRVNDFLIDNSKIGLKDKSYFFHMLAVMLDAGIALVAGMKALAYRSDNPRFKRILNTIAYNCEGGAKLSDAMTRFEDVFDEAEIGIVRSGEATGRLHLMLFKLSSQLDKRYDLKMKLWGAATYPLVVFFVLMVVGISMIVWVLPNLLSFLDKGGVSHSELPIATRILVWMQIGITDFWWLILLIVFGIYGMFRIYVSSDYGAVRWDFYKLKMPLVGALLRKIYVLRFISLLGLLIEAGVPVIKALKISGTSLSNRMYRLKVQEVINEVRHGHKISSSLADSEFMFPSEVVQMMSVGETSASLGKVSEKVADQYQREIDNTLRKLSSVFEPVMILVVGIFVAILALAIMSPIFNLTKTIGGI